MGPGPGSRSKMVPGWSTITEFKNAPAGTNPILAVMFVFYLVSLVLITAARF